MRIQPALEPSCVLQPSKYKVQISTTTELVPTLVLCTSILQSSFALVECKEGAPTVYLMVHVMVVIDNTHDQPLRNISKNNVYKAN